MNLIICDLDGVIADGRPVICECHNYTFRKFGLPAVDEERITSEAIGKLSLEAGFSHFYPDLTPEQVSELARAYRERYAEVCTEARLYPGVKETLAKLEEARHCLAIASIRVPEYSEKILRGNGIRQHFRYVAGIDLGTLNYRDKQSIIGKALDHVDRPDFERRFMVGDAPEDIRGGRHHELFTVAATYGYSSREELEAEGPDYFIDSFGELVGIVD